MDRIARRAALRKLAAGSLGAAASALWVDELGAFAREQAVHTHATIAAASQSTAGWTPKTLNRHQLEKLPKAPFLVSP